MQLAALVDDRPGDGVFRVHRDIFRDEAIFELEIERIFHGGWVYVAHASQCPLPHDYLTVTIGRQPLVVMRDGSGRLGCFVNSCRHKGALVCHAARGNAKVHVCRYHGWSYDSAGRNVAIKSRAAGGYSPAFDCESHGLQPVAHLDEYRGLLFACLRPQSISLAEHLGDSRVFIDLVIDQSEAGIEFVAGNAEYSFEANWKLQLENSIDAYHFNSTHASYLRLLDRRARAPREPDAVAAIWQAEDGRELEDTMGSFGFAHGHALVWTTTPPERHPLYARYGALCERVGEVRAKWMLRTRQLDVFPNLQIASNAALQLRVIEPLAVDRTRMRSFCVAPVGEPREARRQRLRQYEDFFNPSGLATPDDMVTYEDCQHGFRSRDVEWQQGYARGIRLVRKGADEHARELGIDPETSVEGPFELADETVMHALYRGWRSAMAAPEWNV